LGIIATGSGAWVGADAVGNGRRPKVVVRCLEKHFPVGGTLLQKVMGTQPRVRAIDGIDFTINHGEVFGLLGESGSGKTTVGRVVLGLLDATGGEVLYEGRAVSSRLDRSMRQRMQIIFQDPHASLNPAMTVFEGIEHPLLIHRDYSRSERQARVHAIMEKVGLVPPEVLAGKYPGDLSGGQRQRAVIARAMILNPDFVVADEPVSMLDMSIRAKILKLLLDLKEEFDLTYLFITHDLATAKFVCDRVGIMYLGELVEVGGARAIFDDPLHPYTKALMEAIPVPDPRRRGEKRLPKGEIPDAVRPPAGCRFHPRCPEALPECGWEPRDLVEIIDQRLLELAEAEGREGPEEFQIDMKEEPSRRALIVANRASVRRLLDEEREKATPLACAIKDVRAEEKYIEVRFKKPTDVRAAWVGDRAVRCLRIEEGGRR